MSGSPHPSSKERREAAPGKTKRKPLGRRGGALAEKKGCLGVLPAWGCSEGLPCSSASLCIVPAGWQGQVGVGPGVGWAVPSVSLSPVEAAPADSVSFPFLESSR